MQWSQIVKELIKEVGRIPKALALATGYLEKNSLTSIPEYIKKLQAAKEESPSQGAGSSLLPEVRLGLENLSVESQMLMRYAGYLDPDYIPLGLLAALLGLEHGNESLQGEVNALEGLSLLEVVPGKEQGMGLAIHREVQAACRIYRDWQEPLQGAEVVKKLVEALVKEMPCVSANPDEDWEKAKLYAPHLAALLGSKKLGSDGHTAYLLACMGQYAKVVISDYGFPYACKAQTTQDSVLGCWLDFAKVVISDYCLPCACKA